MLAHKIVALALLATISFSTLSSEYEPCEVTIAADVTESLKNLDLFISIKGESYPVSLNNSSVCLERSALGTFPRKFSPDSVSLITYVDKMPIVIYSARAHYQASHIELNAVSTLADSACEMECGFNEYQTLLGHQDVIKASQRYIKKVINKEKYLLDFDKRRKKYARIAKKVKSLHKSLLPKVEQLASLPALAGEYKGRFHSGSTKFLGRYLKLEEIFLEHIRSNINKELSGKKDKESRKLLDEIQQRMINVYQNDNSWDEKSLKFNQIANEVSAHEHPAAKAMGQLIMKAVDVVEQELQLYYQASGNPLTSIAASDLSPSEVVAHWYRYAYYYAGDVDIFSELFSNRLRKKLIDELPGNSEMDRSLSQLLSLFNRLSIIEGDKYALSRLMFEYGSNLESAQGEFTVDNALETLKFKYEDGQWRLDEFKVAMRGS